MFCDAKDCIEKINVFKLLTENILMQDDTTEKRDAAQFRSPAFALPCPTICQILIQYTIDPVHSGLSLVPCWPCIGCN